MADLERLVAITEKLEAKMMANVYANQVKIIAKTDAHQERMEAKMDAWLVEMNACRKETTACKKRRRPV
jgi:hypothetical protein